MPGLISKVFPNFYPGASNNEDETITPDVPINAEGCPMQVGDFVAGTGVLKGNRYIKLKNGELTILYEKDGKVYLADNLLGYNNPLKKDYEIGVISEPDNIIRLVPEFRMLSNDYINNIYILPSLGKLREIHDSFEAKTGGQICKSESQVKNLQDEKTQIMQSKIASGFSNEVDIYFQRKLDLGIISIDSLAKDYKITAKWKLKTNIPFVEISIPRKEVPAEDLKLIDNLLSSSTAEAFSVNLKLMLDPDRTRLIKDDSSSNKPLPIEKVNDLLYGTDEIPK
jgi:hypothetical protein